MSTSEFSTGAFEHYLRHSTLQHRPAPGAYTGAAGGAPCGDLVRISLSVDGGRITDASFDAEGCAATRAATAAVAELSAGATILDAAALTPERLVSELGGLSPAFAHAAELAADALHRALSLLVADPRGRLSTGDPADRPRVLVALSGGVDSAVAALLERDDGAEVVAVTLKLWADQRNDGERSCCSPEAVLRARRLAHSLGLPHFTLDLTEEFRAGVVSPFLEGHREGTTPNPCVMCNGSVRIDAMVDLARRLDAEGLATGHYARVVDDGEGPLLGPPADREKDQTYMLSSVRPATLRDLRFPLAELTKPQVRALAERAGLPVAGRPESQDLCFLAGEGKQAFLERHDGLSERPGDVVDSSGHEIGRHPGHHNFTVGQRRGLGVAAREPLYVLRTDASSNRVVAGSRAELRTTRVSIRDAVLHRDADTVDRVRLRYRSKPLACRVSAPEGGAGRGRHARLALELAEHADAAAPGQTATLMAGERIVGHGTITRLPDAA